MNKSFCIILLFSFVVFSCSESNVSVKTKDSVYYIVFILESTETKIAHQLKALIQDQAREKGQKLHLAMIKTLDPELLHVVVRKFRTSEDADQILESVLDREEYRLHDHKVHRTTILEQEQYNELFLHYN